MAEKALPAIFVWAPRVASVLTTAILVLGGALYVLRDSNTVRSGVAEMAGFDKLALQLEAIAKLQGELTVQLAALGQSVGNNAGQVRRLAANVGDLGKRIADMNSDAETRTLNASIERDELRRKLEEATRRLGDVEKAVNTNLDATPPIEFLENGNKIEATDGNTPTTADGTPQLRIGSRVRFTWAYRKIRDCGQATPVNLVIDSDGVTAQLTNVSTLGTDGKGILDPVDPDKVLVRSYTAIIPADKGLAPGPEAYVWVSASYDEDKCPAVDPVISPRLEVVLLPATTR